ncbi:MAG: hypothetical protein ACXQS2_05395 [Methermicoccaceae archaeon]
MRIPQCPTGNLVGFGKVRHWKRKRRKKRKRLPKIGIVELCKEGKEFLAKYDDSGKIKDIPECDLIKFAEVESGDGVKIRTAYHDFIKKCVREHQGSMKDRMRICAQKWHEEKKKKRS